MTHYRRNAPWRALLLFPCALLPFRAGAQARPNALLNSGFEAPGPTDRPEGWDALWTRDPSAGRMALDTEIKHGGAASLKIVHTGRNDWAVAQTTPTRVAPGDILAFGAWIKCEKTTGTEISVVTRRADGETLSWQYGAASTSGTHNWLALTRKIVVPPGCATVQFRLTGTGPGTVWMDDATLIRQGNVRALQAYLQARSFHMRNRMLDVTLDAAHGTLTVKDKRNGRIWKQAPYGQNILVQEARQQAPGTLRLTLWDIENDIKLQAALALAADRPEIELSLEGSGRVQQPIAFPAPFVTSAGTGLVVPLNEGILYPVADKTIPAMQLVAYGGHGICMPWFGVTDETSGAGVLTILETPDDARIDITRQAGTGLFIRPLWEASRESFRYTRKLSYTFFDRGGYPAQARHYRAYSQRIGLFKTLAQKRLENPHVDLLIGAANIWNWDSDKVALCREMKALGMERVLWSSGGSPEEIDAINALGYLTGRYDIYQDVWPPGSPAGMRTAGWPDDLVSLKNGDWMRGWADKRKNADGTETVIEGGVISSPRGLARAKQMIPADLKTHAYRGRFLDTTTASPFREDYNPAHPLTRSEDRRYKMKLLEFCSRDMKLVVGTETGIDPSVPYVHYYEGMLSLGPYRLPDAGRDLLQYKAPTPDFLKFQIGPYYRVPLWELVYHDCVVAQWYWGDYNNKAPEVWDRRDLFNILYGTPPMFMFDRATWDKEKAHFVRSYRSICPLVRRLGYDEMLSHAFLNADHTVQRTRWHSGVEIIVNFGSSPYALKKGIRVPGMGWRVGSWKVGVQAVP